MDKPPTREPPKMRVLSDPSADAADMASFAMDAPLASAPTRTAPADAPAPPPAVAPPPEVFMRLLGPDGRLPRDEIEACLVAIGLRKSVLALAKDAFKELTADAADRGAYSLSEFWGALNARSRVVFESKLRAFEGSAFVLFALVLACREYVPAGAVAGKWTATAAEVRATLAALEDEALDLDAALASVDSAGFDAAGWVGALPSEPHDELSRALRRDPPVDLAGSGGQHNKMSANQSIIPGELPPPSEDALADACGDDEHIDEAPPPGFDPLANAVETRRSEIMRDD